MRILPRIHSIIILFAFFFLAGCEGRSLSPGHPYSLNLQPPPGPPAFQQGWKEGCESGLAGMGNQFTKLFHSFQYDAEQAKDKVYERSWSAGNLYCRTFIYTTDFYHRNSRIW